jgi:hypothetical protein
MHQWSRLEVSLSLAVWPCPVQTLIIVTQHTQPERERLIIPSLQIHIHTHTHVVTNYTVLDTMQLWVLALQLRPRLMGLRALSVWLLRL